MSADFPLGFLYSLPPRPKTRSLGDHIAEHVTDNGRISTLIDCLPSTSNPALWSPDLSRPPLEHRHIKSFVSNFILPSAPSRKPLGPNDRVMMALPTGPENALASSSPSPPTTPALPSTPAAPQASSATTPSVFAHAPSSPLATQ